MEVQLEETLQQNVERSCYSFFATSGILMSRFFEGLPLFQDFHGQGPVISNCQNVSMSQ